ncbi:MAG TPA: trypsin-like serine protease [Candidatus Thermoplasmatota archaeon]|jgi:hypothetical protein|nr:trypsin-like serine protease [Candidatus Thermoplasmatota archaeon]
MRGPRGQAILLLALVVGAGAVSAARDLCQPVTLPAPAEALAALAEEGHTDDLSLVAWPGLDPGSAQETHSCSGEIRPGAPMTSPSVCTMSWILRDDEGRNYQTTAGHCAPVRGQTVSVQGVGPIGTVVFTTGDGGFGNDIALVRITPGLAVNPTLCHWGGPTGIATPDMADLPGVGNYVLHYGWGTAFMLTGATRARVADLTPIAGVSGWFDDGSVRMIGATDGGDSGSPVMIDNGRAAGIHTHRINAAATLVGPKVATRLDVWVPRLEEELKVDLELQLGLPLDLTGLSIP